MPFIKGHKQLNSGRTFFKNGITICKKCDLTLVMNHEPEWESYFYFNLNTRRIDEFL